MSTADKDGSGMDDQVADQGELGTQCCAALDGETESSAAKQTTSDDRSPYRRDLPDRISMRENQRKSNENRHLDDRVEPEAAHEKAVCLLPVARSLGSAAPLDECGDEAEVRNCEAESQDRGQEREVAVARDADPAGNDRVRHERDREADGGVQGRPRGSADRPPLQLTWG